MAVKYMTKEVINTRVKIAKMSVVDGLPVAEPLEDETLLGNISLEKAQRAMKKKHGEGVTVFGVEPNATRYTMPVETFVELATVVPVTPAAPETDQ